jgi:hypothetical protein
LTGGAPFLASIPAERRKSVRDCAWHKEALDARLYQLGAKFLAGSTATDYGVMARQWSAPRTRSAASDRSVATRDNRRSDKQLCRYLWLARRWSHRAPSCCRRAHP